MRLSPAGAKDGDARVLRCGLTAASSDDSTRPIVAWTRVAEDLMAERLANRRHQPLWRYYLQFLKLAGDLSKEWILWKLAPSPAKARRVRRETVNFAAISLLVSPSTARSSQAPCIPRPSVRISEPHALFVTS